MDGYCGKEPMCCPIVNWGMFPRVPSPAVVLNWPQVTSSKIWGVKVKQLPLLSEGGCWLELMRRQFEKVTGRGLIPF